MSLTAGWVVPNMLRELRERTALEPKDVEAQARKLGRLHYSPVTREELERWEQGLAAPELAHLETLSEIYGCPVGHFFLEQVPERAESLSYRGLAPGKDRRLSPDTRRSLGRFLELAEWFTAAINDHDLPWEVHLRRLAHQADLEALVAEQRRELGFSDSVRSQWGSPRDAFAWWRRRVEALGVFCFQLKLDPKDIRGASLWRRGGCPCVLVNHQDAETAPGRLFTLLHEYGHLLTSSDPHGIACDFRGREAGQGGEPG